MVSAADRISSTGKFIFILVISPKQGKPSRHRYISVHRQVRIAIQPNDLASESFPQVENPDGKHARYLDKGQRECKKEGPSSIFGMQSNEQQLAQVQVRSNPAGEAVRG